MSEATAVAIDPVFAALDEAKRLHRNVDFEASGTDSAAQEWDVAFERVQRTRHSTALPRNAAPRCRTTMWARSRCALHRGA
jgi:hypothetical protein